MPDLWPPDFGKLGLTPPISILREQAESLSNRTKGTVVGNVVTTSKDSTFLHSFNLLVPNLDNYSYRLFTATHDLARYPVKIGVTGDANARESYTPEQFMQHLQSIFASDATRRVMVALLAQVQSSEVSY